MSIDLNTVSLPFDRWGTAATNKIVGERQTLTSVAWTEFNILIPEYAPFYSGTIADNGITHIPSGKKLVRGVDWVEGWYFQSASGEIGLDIHCCIYFYDNTLAGEVEIASYQAMGGEWQLSGKKLEEVLAQNLLNPLRYYWEQIAELPSIFNPLDHDQDIQDFTKLGDLIDVLGDIAKAVGKDTGALELHIADKNNPHGTNSDQVGLGKVQNWPIALAADIVAGKLTTQAYMNPPMTWSMINAVALAPLNAFIARRDNPQVVTAAQTGAYSKTESDALLESLARGLIHNIYAYRLEGKSVQEIVDLARSDASGSMDDLRQQIQAVSDALTVYGARRDNPNNVRADQTGGYFTTEVNALLDSLAAGTLHNVYAYRLEGKSVQDIVNSATAAVGDQITASKDEIMSTVSQTLANYQAADTSKFAGKDENQWNQIIDDAVAAHSNGWDIWPASEVTSSTTEASVILIAQMSENDNAGGLGTDSAHRGVFGFRVMFGSPVGTSARPNYVDVFLQEGLTGGWGIGSGSLPTGVSFFIDYWYNADGTLRDGDKRLYMNAPANFTAITVTPFSMLGVTAPAETDIWKASVFPPSPWTSAKTAVALVSLGTKEMSDAVQTNLNTLSTAVSTLATTVGTQTTNIAALTNSAKVRYAQSRTIEAGAKITLDLQTLITDPADVAKYDFLGARIRVWLLDTVTGSNTKDAYINPEGTVTTAIRGSRYLDLWNYDTAQVTVIVRVEIPLL